MSKVCEICGKKTISMNQISHAHNKTKRKAFPNLRMVKGRRICARCIKSGKARLAS